jgi:very-short-patch-repair endonuclease
MDAPRSTKAFAKGLRRRMTLPEVLLWRCLKGRRLAGRHFRKQHPLGPYVLDFYCDELRLAVEVDGEGHSFDPARDERRDAWLAARGVRTLRIRTATVLTSPTDAAQTILEFANSDAPPQGELPRSG